MNTQSLNLISSSCHKRYSVYLGTATAALTIACQLSSPKKRKIALPSIACVSVLHSVLLSGCTPIFVDVLSDTGLLDTSHLAALCAQDPEIDAIIAVHLYGFVLDMEPLLAISRKFGLSLIEDFAQCQGSRYSNNQPVGSLGDFSIVSFGHTKILDVGGGGLLLTNNKHSYQKALHISRQYACLSQVHRNFLSDQFRQTYYQLYDQNECNKSLLMRIGDMAYSYQGLYLRQGSPDEFQYLLKQLPDLDDNASRRRLIWSIYYNSLKTLDCIEIPLLNEGGVPWRFTFTARKTERDRIVTFLRSHNVDVSTWYPPLFRFREIAGHSYHKYKANSFADRVINLWLDQNTTECQVLLTCTLLRKFLS